jgi:hypothetical protein
MAALTANNTQSATASGLPTSSQTATSNHSSESSTRVVLGLTVGILFIILWILICCFNCCFRKQKPPRIVFRTADEEVNSTLADDTEDHDEEKRLITISELNHRFPIVKYKTWCGIAPSTDLRTTNRRPFPSSSSKRAEYPSLEDRKRDSQRDATKTSFHEKIVQFNEVDVPLPGASKLPSSEQTSQAERKHSSQYPNLEDGHISLEISHRSAVQPGTVCPICLDTLVDEDDVRVLSCNHVFHAACLERWLTCRYARCPLCNRDYYVPETFLHDRASADGAITPNQSRLALPQQPQGAWLV